MNGMKFKSINNRLILWFVIVSLVPLIVMTALTYDQRIRSVRTEAFNKLEAIRTLKSAQIRQWIDQGKDRLNYMATAVENSGLSRIIEGRSGTVSERSWSLETGRRLEEYQGSTEDILGITVTDLNGNILITTFPDGQEGNLSSE